MIKPFKIFCISILIFALYACADKPLTKDDQIRQYIQAARLAAEARSHSDLADLIHQSYRDHRYADKNKLIKMVGAYFFTHQNIHLFTQIDSIFFQAEDRAFVTLHIAMAGTVIANVHALGSLRAKLYKFELLLVKEDNWLLQHAKWQPASLQDML